MNINLFVQYLESEDEQRNNEYNICRERNKNNKYIDNFITIQKDGYLKYKDFFKRTRKYPKDINILANSDIFFDDSISFCKHMRRNDCLALTRRELLGDPRDVDNSVLTDIPSRIATNTQDAWVFNGPVCLSVYGDIFLGHPGCDNRIAWEIKDAGYKVMNPCEDIRSYHLHKEYKNNDTNKKRGEKFRIHGNDWFLPICRMIINPRVKYILEDKYDKNNT